MNTISITIDENLKYSIELKEEYKAEEFIATFEGHINKVKNLLSSFGSSGNATSGRAEIQQGVPFKENELFKKLSALIETLGKDIYKEDHSTMRSYKFNRAYRRKGFAWLAPKGQSLVVYLRKGNHSSVDRENRIVQKSTFGGFPMLYIKNLDEVDYTFNIIKKIYQSPS
jgi:hypothetical protein